MTSLKSISGNISFIDFYAVTQDYWLTFFNFENFTSGYHIIYAIGRINMNKTYILSVFLFCCMSGNNASGYSPGTPLTKSSEYTVKDTLSENQALYNGRICRNLYYMINGNQFLFSNELLTGTVCMRGKNFTNINIKYDVFKDELLTPIDHGKILQLNKELVDSFSIQFQNKQYHFIRLKVDSTNSPGEYFCVLYSGKSALYVKYIKKINKLSISGESDSFYQNEKLYFVKNKQFMTISGRGDLLRAMNDKRDQIKSFIRKNKLSVSETEPEKIVPVIRYFDSISQ